jgi:hypothetical protein
MYKLLRNEIDRLLSGKIVIELNFFEDCKGFTNPNTLDFCQLFADNRGSVNHLNTDANLVVFKEIDRLISQKYK